MSRDHPWFALHDDVLHDAKLARVKRATRQPRMVVLGAWTTILILSNQSPVRGVLLVREDRPLRTQELFDEWELPDAEAQTLLDAFIDQGLVCREDDAWVVCNWEQRQPRSDSSTERVRRWRERQKELKQDVTDVTLHETLPETECNGTEIEREIEREIEEEEGGGGSTAADNDDEYAHEALLEQIVIEGTDLNAATRPRARSDPDDAAAERAWGAVLNLCGNDADRAGAVFVVAHDLAVQLEWVKPLPHSDYELRVAMSDWWRPIKRALEARGWDAAKTGQAMIAAAQAMYQCDLSPSKPGALMGELSKQKATRARASPELGANGAAGGVDAIREKIKQRGSNGRH